MLPEIQRIDAEIFNRQRNNQDAADLLLKKKKIAEDRTRAYISSLTGKIPENNPQFERAITAMGDDFAQFNQEAGRNIRSVTDAATSKEDQRIREEAIAVDQQQANTAAGNLAQKSKPGESELSKAVTPKINKLIEHLLNVQKGVGGDLSQGAYGDIENIKAPQIDKVLEKLSGLQSKSMGEALTPDDLKFIDKQWNVFGMDAQITALTQKLIAKGWNPEEAKQAAIEFVMGK